MRPTKLLYGSLLLVACAGRASYGGGDGGPSGTGGYWNAGGTNNTGGWVTTGGYWNVGGSVTTGGYPNTGGSIATGGYMNTGGSIATGGYMNTGGAIATGGYSNTGGYGLAEPVWASPIVETVCAGNPAPPAVAKWVDDFEGGPNVFNPVLVTGWEVFSDVEETITGGQGAVLSTPLSLWGSHDPRSTYGMQMQGYVSTQPVAGKNSWGAGWQLVTDVVPSPGRAVMNMGSYTGLVLWARLAGAPGKGSMLVVFETPETTIAESGGDGTCSSTATTGVASCYADFQAPAKVTKTCWSSIQIPFSTLKVPYGNTPSAGFDKAHVFGLVFSFSAWATLLKANWPVDVIVDDVYLY
jgi:hypothetical protein